VTNDLLACLIEANLAAAATILIVLALRRLARVMIGLRAAYALWLIVPAAMLATFLPPRIIMMPAPAAASIASLPVFGAPEAALAQGRHAALAIPSTGATLDSAQVLLSVWVVGVAVSLILLAVGQRRALARFGPLTADAKEPRFARASKSGVGPAVVGVFRPWLIVPADFETRFDASERAMILAHERAHLASGHALINALTALLQAVNWFNPLIHLAIRYARIDQELACDAAVISQFPAGRRTYAQALLKTQFNAAALPFGCAWPARSPSLLAQRIELLAQDAPGRVRRFAGAAIVASLMVGAGVAAWAAEPPVTELAKPARSPQAAIPKPAAMQPADAAAALSRPSVPFARLQAAAPPARASDAAPPQFAEPAQRAQSTALEAAEQLIEQQAPLQVAPAVALVAQSQLASASAPIAIGPAEAPEPVLPPLPKCHDLAGVWRGQANGPDYQGPMILRVAYAKGELAGVLNAPAESPFPQRLLGFRRHGQQIEFTLATMSGWYYAGRLNADGSTITGYWTVVGGLDAFDSRGFNIGHSAPGSASVPTEFKCSATAP
jgi:beta-lactamase regulating signal transducer with metallopeptidase domain